MTRKILFSVATLLLGITSFAQVKFGIRAGVQRSNFHVMVDQAGLDLNPKNTFDAGLMLEIPFSPWFAIQPEIGYSVYGSKLSMPGTAGQYKMEYFSLPVLAKYKLKNGLAFLVGPSFNFLTAASIQEDGQEKQDARAFIKKNDIMVTGGVEYNFPFGLSLGARVNHSLKNVTAEDQVNGLRYFGLGLHLAYKFNVSEKKK